MFLFMFRLKLNKFLSKYGTLASIELDIIILSDLKSNDCKWSEFRKVEI